jgi:hypothetical protein
VSELDAYQEIHAVPVGEREPGRGLVKAVAPATQAMAAAAGGLLAGAAIVGIVGRRRARRTRGPAVARRRAGGRAGRGAGELVRIVGTRSLLVDVHLLDRAH